MDAKDTTTYIVSYLDPSDSSQVKFASLDIPDREGPESAAAEFQAACEKAGLEPIIYSMYTEQQMIDATKRTNTEGETEIPDEMFLYMFGMTRKQMIDDAKTTEESQDDSAKGWAADWLDNLRNEVFGPDWKNKMRNPDQDDEDEHDSADDWKKLL